MKKQYLAVFLLLLVGTLTHMVGLSLPRQVIFDEVHFGKFVTAYCCTGERFFDIHPPHAKLLIAGVGWLGGFRGGFPFDHIGEVYGEVPIASLRFLPALTGLLLPLVIYGLSRHLGTSSQVAALGAGTVLLDNALTIQTRVIALDGLLLLATFGSLLAFLHAEHDGSRWSWWWYALAGASAGIAAGTKFTGLAAPALLGIIVVVRLVKQRQLYWLLRGIVILMVAVVVYLGGWALHYSMLPLPGPGDAFLRPEAIMTDSLVVTTRNFWRETVALHRVMLTANYNLTATHPDMSPWWSWPLMLVSVFYWQGNAGQALIYFLGNPVVWWGSSLLLLAMLGEFVWLGGRHVIRRPNSLWIPLFGYGISMLPLVRVPRALFLYHYLTPLVFAVLVGLLWLDRLEWWQRQGAAWQQRVVMTALVAMSISFIWFSPVTFGLTVPTMWQTGIFWLPGWR